METTKNDFNQNFKENLADKTYRLISENPQGWLQRWVNCCSMPINFLNKQLYSGVNASNLKLDSIHNGNRPLFFDQESLNKFLGLKGNEAIQTKYVAKKSYIRIPIIKTIDIEGSDAKKTYTFFKGGVVANLDQMLAKYPEYKEKIQEYLVEQDLDIPLNEVDQNKVDQHLKNFNLILDKIGVELIIGGTQPCFIPSKKQVNVPEAGRYNTLSMFIASLAHEVGHSTKVIDSIKGNNERGGKEKYDEKYCFEQLVAEFFSALYCSHFKVKMDENREGYSAHFLNGIKSLYECKKMAFYDAVAIAQKNFDYCLDILNEK